jgi:ribosome small subunit-dependent GTPase A
VHHPDLVPFGFGDRWLAPLAEHPDCKPARVVRHDGSALLLATDDGMRAIPFRAMDPSPTVGDWLAYRDDRVVAVLPRLSLLQRRAVGSDVDTAQPQPLAANVDLVLLVCGLDRAVKPGRIQRGATLAWDAGAVPAVVLTKAATVADAAEVAARVEAENPGLDVVITSAHEAEGIDRLRALVRDKTVTMLGESGAGKSSLLNALMGHDVAAIGRVRGGDRKGSHTTTARELHPLPGGRHADRHTGHPGGRPVGRPGGGRGHVHRRRGACGRLSVRRLPARRRARLRGARRRRRRGPGGRTRRIVARVARRSGERGTTCRTTRAAASREVVRAHHQRSAAPQGALTLRGARTCKMPKTRPRGQEPHDEKLLRVTCWSIHRAAPGPTKAALGVEPEAPTPSQLREATLTAWRPTWCAVGRCRRS